MYNGLTEVAALWGGGGGKRQEVKYLQECVLWNHTGLCLKLWYLVACDYCHSTSISLCVCTSKMRIMLANTLLDYGNNSLRLNWNIHVKYLAKSLPGIQ